MSSEKKLASGWMLDPYAGAVCHFQHYSAADAEKAAEIRERCFIVETINWTIADDDKDSRHLNKYYVPDMASAISLAARMEIDHVDVAEDIIRICPATDAEEATYWKVHQHFAGLLPPAISEQDAEALQDVDDSE